MIDNISYYTDKFSHLSVKITNGQKKPNKAILLLSIIELIRCGYISSNQIYIEETLEESFSIFWKKLVNDEPPSVWIPFWHLKSESFWHFEPINELKEIDALVPHGQTASVGKMKSVIKYAYFDEELFSILTKKEGREVITSVLEQNYL